MIYIYDILLNWTKDLRVKEFFEWSLDDDLEHIKKIPLIRVNDGLMKDVLNSKLKLEKDFLLKIKGKSQSYFHNDIDIIDYAVILSNGKKALAIELDDEGLINYKSVMLLDEEEEVLDMALDLKSIDINYEILLKNNNLAYLTRKEETKRKYLVGELKKIKEKKEESKLNYLYKEFFQEEQKDFSHKYQLLVNEVYKNYNGFHDKLYNLLKLSAIRKK